MKAEQALTTLAEVAGAENGDLGHLLAVAVEASRAQAGFVARVEGTDLRVVAQAGGDLPPALLERVSRGVRESLDGVQNAPPEMTGGAPPPGAVPIKAEAGHPPVHAFPLLEPGTGMWSGVLGLVPDPAAPPEPEPAAAALLVVLRLLLSGRLVPGRTGPAAARAAEGAPELKHDYGEIVTRSPKMQAVLRKLDRVIGTDVPVLISGETGTGKELIANALHRNDPVRRKRRMYSQNCGAISESLLNSELFGYEKGAFTGAERRKKGLFEIASGSTLFLDEIGEMSLDMQTRLLRVLQEGEIVPLGATEPVKVAVRVVAATHRDLDADVTTGRFRQDLLFRLKVVRLQLPALRERPEDIPLLVEHFLHKVARKRGERPKVLDRRDDRIMEALLAYPWPGNVRELENVITRLAYLTRGDVITFDSLAEERHILGTEGAPQALRPVRPLDEVVEEVERNEIENALRHTQGNRTRAASLLGINRRSLLRRLHKYGYMVDENELEGD